jgi:hypothetical protein
MTSHYAAMAVWIQLTALSPLQPTHYAGRSVLVRMHPRAELASVYLMCDL